MTGEPFDIFRLPGANNDGAISTCIPYRLDITSLAVGDLLEIKMKFSGTGKEKERLVEKHLEDSRVQIIVPIKDPEMISPGPPDWIELFYAPGIFLQRKTWDEGNSAKIVIRRDTEESIKVEMDVLIVLNKLSLKPDEFRLMIQSEKVLATGGSQIISEQEIKFTDDKSTICYKGEDENLIDQVFSKKSGYEIKNQGSMFHPKQLHSYNSVYRSLESRIEAESPLNISYIGPDTCENLHSTIRAVNSLVSKGLKVDNFFVLYTQWDERSMESLGITSPGYFEEKGCNFQVKPLRISDKIGIKSDLIISTYVTNWAFNSGQRGSAAEQYLSNILKQIKNENSMIISIDPFDEKRVARSFYQLGHQGAPTIVYQSAGLELQDSAPGGYGDIIQEREREICWVTSYKSKSQTQAIIEPALPKPNDIAQSLGVVSPTGRDAYLERLSTPMLEKYTTWTDAVTHEQIDEEIHGEVDEEIEIQASNDNPDVAILPMESLLETKENFRIIIGGPGDGKTVFLQQIGWSKRSSEDEVTIILSARRLTRKEHMFTLAMYEGEDKIAKFVEILEKESVRKYESLTWAGNIKNWMQSNLTINLEIDALDEVRDIKSRKKLFSYLLEFCNYREDINVTLSMRQNILSKTMRDVERYLETEGVGFHIEELSEYGEDGIESYLAQLPIYRLTWNEGDIVHKFIPSLLRGWNMVIDLQSKNELERFIAKSTRSLNRSSRGSRTFLKNPLRAVWLVRFVYDQSINLDDMDLSEFENEILRLSVKNRFENRRRIDSVSDNILDELLDFVATLSVLDYEWEGNENNFTSEEREKFVNLIITSDAVSEFFRDVNRNDLQLFLYEDMSLLYVADDDNLAWIHENLREHAIARGLMKYNLKNSIPNALLSSWGFEPPSIYDIFFNPEKTCSVELSDAIRRIIPDDLLIEITKNWLKSPMAEESDVYPYELINFKADDKFTGLNELLSICNELANVLKDKRDDLNSQTQDLTHIRNDYNSKVKHWISKYREQREKRDEWNEIVKQRKRIREAATKKLKQAKTMLSESSSIDDKSAKVYYQNAMDEQELAHNEVKKAAVSAQDAHQQMVENNKVVDEMRELAQKSHHQIRDTKRAADRYHGRYIFLIKRLNRELKKRLRYLVLSNYNPDGEGILELVNHVKDIVLQYYTEESHNNSKIPLLSHSDISVIPRKFECKIIIQHDEGGYFAGKNGKRINTLNKILNRDFNLNFVLEVKGNEVPVEDIEALIYENLQEFKQQNPEAEKLDISSIEFSNYNRKLVLITRDIAELYKFNSVSRIKKILTEKFGGSFVVYARYMDVDPGIVKEEVKNICDRLMISDCLVVIEAATNKKGLKGRKVVIGTTDIDLFIKSRKEILDSLTSKFGPKFTLDFTQDLPPLELKKVEDKIIPIIEKLTNHIDDFNLQEIKLGDLHTMKDRCVFVRSSDKRALVGESGLIAKQIEYELKQEFGYLRFISLEPEIKGNEQS